MMSAQSDPEHQAATLDMLAEYYLSGGHPAKAQPLLDRALQLIEASSDAALRGTILCNRGHALSLLNERDGAIAELDRGIALSRVDSLAASRCLQKRAFVAQNFNDAQNALKYTQLAQSALAEYPAPRADQQASLTADLAYAHYLSGHTAEADRYYAQALAEYERLGRGTSPVTFSLRNNWGIASYAAGDTRRALENYDEALRIAKQRDPNGDLPTYLLVNRALALASLARYPEALDAFAVALEVARRTNNVGSELHALVNTAGTYLQMGAADRATALLADVDRKFGAQMPDDSVPATTIRYIKGRIASVQGDLTQADALLTQTIEFFDRRQMAISPVTRALNARAEVKLKSGNVAAARADAQRALDISQKLQDAKPYSSLTGLSLLQLAEVESVAGERAKSQAAAKGALANLTQSLGPEHPDAMRARALATP
jgi:tetratricopeptide (TPR) repeat protein